MYCNGNPGNENASYYKFLCSNPVTLLAFLLSALPAAKRRLLLLLEVCIYCRRIIYSNATFEMGITTLPLFVQKRGNTDERASSQGSHGAKGAKEAKDLALGKAKMPRD